MGFFDEPKPVTFQLYQEALQKFRLSAEGVREPVAPETHRQRILETFSPLPQWYQPFEEAMVSRGIFRITRSPSAAGGDVSFVGIDERLAASDPHEERALCARRDLQCGRDWRRATGPG